MDNRLGLIAIVILAIIIAVALLKVLGVSL